MVGGFGDYRVSPNVLVVLGFFFIFIANKLLNGHCGIETKISKNYQSLKLHVIRILCLSLSHLITATDHLVLEPKVIRTLQYLTNQSHICSKCERNIRNNKKSF